MVQITNPSRLTQKIRFCKESETVEYDQNDTPMRKVSKIDKWVTLGAPWSLSTNQMIQSQGLNLTNNKIYAVHHRPEQFWHDIDFAVINNIDYELVDINADTTNSPTSFDLITLKEVEKHG